MELNFYRFRSLSKIPCSTSSINACNVALGSGSYDVTGARLFLLGYHTWPQVAADSVYGIGLTLAWLKSWTRTGLEISRRSHGAAVWVVISCETSFDTLLHVELCFRDRAGPRTTLGMEWWRICQRTHAFLPRISIRSAPDDQSLPICLGAVKTVID